MTAAACETKPQGMTTGAARLRQTSFLKSRNSNSKAKGFGTIFKFNDLPKLPPLHLVPRNFYEGRGPAFLRRRFEKSAVGTAGRVGSRNGLNAKRVNSIEERAGRNRLFGRFFRTDWSSCVLRTDSLNEV